jgi:hypothetical protein
MNNNIWEQVIEIIKIGSAGYGAIWFKDYLDNRKKELNKPSLSDDDKNDEIQEVLDIIKEHIGANIVAFWEGSNGETTLSGFHKKKLSLVCESVTDSKFSGLGEMDNVPVKNFKRNIDALKVSEDDYIVSYEFDKFDELAALHQSYGIGTMVVFKVITGNNIKKWTGLLCVGFSDKPKLLTDADLAWMSLQAGRLGNKLTL